MRVFGVPALVRRLSQAEFPGGSAGRRRLRVVLAVTLSMGTVVIVAPFALLLAVRYPWGWLVDLEVSQLERDVDAVTAVARPPAEFGQATRVSGPDSGCAGFFTTCAIARDDYRVEVATQFDADGTCHDLAEQAEAAGYAVSRIRDHERADGDGCYFSVSGRGRFVSIDVDSYRDGASDNGREPWQLTASYRTSHQF
ncbi:hypothetical protein [Jannaschia sp. R86511]|uniref:hypothetical protein n=1 Tax=Jannaschia sp. R86511 TaxID=3093853 RepID=UPI0036D391EF